MIENEIYITQTSGPFLGNSYQFTFDRNNLKLVWPVEKMQNIVKNGLSIKPIISGF